MSTKRPCIACYLIILVCLWIFTGAILSVFIPEIRRPSQGGGYDLTPEEASQAFHERWFK